VPGLNGSPAGPRPAAASMMPATPRSSSIPQAAATSPNARCRVRSGMICRSRASSSASISAAVPTYRSETIFGRPPTRAISRKYQYVLPLIFFGYRLAINLGHTPEQPRGQAPNQRATSRNASASASHWASDNHDHRKLRLGLEPPQGQLQHVGAAARAVVGGDEVAADPQRVEDHAAGLDVVLVGAEGTEQRAQVIHAPVVDASEALGDRLFAPGPVADCEVDPQRLVAGGGERGQSPQLGPGVPTLALDALDHLVDAHPLPRVEYLLEQRAPVVEVPVEAAPGDAERPRQQLDPDGVRAAGGKRPQPLFDPAAAWRACRGGHHLSV